MDTMAKRVGSPSLAVAYLRASKDEQKLSPETQRAAIEAWATREVVRVIAWRVDQGVTSVTPVEDPPALVRALGELRARRAGALVCAKRDRIARDAVLAATVERAVESAGAVLVSASGEGNGTTPTDMMVRGIVDVFAQYERGLIQIRTKAALAAKRARGEKTGGDVPYGYRVASDGSHLEGVQQHRRHFLCSQPSHGSVDEADANPCFAACDGTLVVLG